MSAGTVFLIGLVIAAVIAGSVLLFLNRSRQSGGCWLHKASFGPWAREEAQSLDFYPDPSPSSALNITKSRFTLTAELSGNSTPKVFELDSRSGSSLKLRSEFPDDLIDFGESPAKRNFTFRVSLSIQSADPVVTNYRFFGDDNAAEIEFSLGPCYLSSYSGFEFSEEPNSSKHAPEFNLGNELTFTLYLLVAISD